MSILAVYDTIPPFNDFNSYLKWGRSTSSALVPLSDVPMVRSYPLSENGHPVKTAPKLDANLTEYPQYNPASSRGAEGDTTLHGACLVGVPTLNDIKIQQIWIIILRCLL